MEKVLRLFDYFKLAFALNKENKGLYKPQILLIFIKTCLIIIIGLIIYDYTVLFSNMDLVTEKIVFSKIFSSLGIFATLILASIIIKIFVESGLYNMYKDCIKEGLIQENSFSNGVKNYFIKFLLADLLMLFAWIIMLVPYVIIGFFTLFAGFMIIPIIISIFTAMWKVSIVMDEESIVEALKRSFKFAKLNFWPLSFLIIIKNSFAGFASSGGSGANSASNFNSTGSEVTSGILPDYYNDVTNSAISTLKEILPYIKLGLFIIIPIISIAVVISSLIKMIFDVFFSLSIFIMYSENLMSEKIDLVKEVL